MDYEFPPETEDYLRTLFRGAIYNAKRLADDAVTMFKAGGYPTAQYLALTSMEEVARTMKLRTPFILPQDSSELEAALKSMAEIVGEFEDKGYSALEVAPYVPAYNAWEMSVDSISRVTERWGADVLTKKRLACIQPDINTAAGTAQFPEEAGSREEAYHFISTAYLLLAEYGEKALNPFPMVSEKPEQVFEAFDFWQNVEATKSAFLDEFAFKFQPVEKKKPAPVVAPRS
jgi:AbiV family abortive infection protein